MTNTSFQQWSAKLIDGELDQKTLLLLEAHLKENPDAIEALMAELTLSECLHQHFNEEKSFENFSKSFEFYLDHGLDKQSFVSETMRKIDDLSKGKEKKKKIIPFKRHRLSNAQNVRRRKWFNPMVNAALAASFFIILGLNLIFHPSDSPIATLQPKYGSVTIKRGTDSIECNDGQLELLPGDVITARQGEATIHYADDNTWINLSKNSTLVLAGLKGHREGGKNVTLRQGKIKSNISPQKVSRPMIFWTRQMRTKILGTTISLSAEPEKTHLHVHKGRVETYDLYNRQVTILNTGSEAIAQIARYVPVIGPLDSVIHERWHLDAKQPFRQLIEKFSKRSKFKKTSLDQINISSYANNILFGRAQGYIIAPREGKYTFRLDSNTDASIILKSIQTSSVDIIDQIELKPNQSISKNLPGIHRIAFKLYYLFSAKGQKVKLYWSGPGFSEKVLSAHGALSST